MKKHKHDFNTSAVADTKFENLGEQRISFIAILVGILSIIIALSIGYVAYRYTFKMTEKRFHSFYLNKAKMLAAEVKSYKDFPDDVVLNKIDTLWRETGDKPSDEYVCMVDNNVSLILHTKNPDTIGNYAGDNLVLWEDNPHVNDLLDLSKYQKDFVGGYISSNGQEQIAAFAPVPQRGWTIGVHRSREVFVKEIKSSIWFLIVGFIAVCGFLLPTSLVLLYVTFRSSYNKRRKAEGELRKHYDQLQELVNERTAEITETNEKLRDEIAERKMTEEMLHVKSAYLRLLQVTAVAANEATEIKDTFQPILNEICNHTGWPIGHAYIISKDDPNLLEPTTVWYIEDVEKFTNFRNVTEMTKFAKGIGLPGRVLASGKPLWIVDVTKDKNFLRTKIARNMHIKSGIAFPVMVGTKVTAVLEFFSTEVAEPNQQFLDVMSDVGTQLGRVVERKNAEEKLLASESSARRLIESNIIGVAIADFHGHLLEANGVFLEMVGYTREEVADRQVLWSEMTPPEYRHLDEHAIEQVKATGSCTTYEKEFFCKNGERVPIVLGAALLEGKEDVCVVFILDITERRIAEVERIRSRQKSLLHTQRTPLAVIEWNANFEVTEWNPAAEKIFGYIKEEALGRHAEFIIHENAKEHVDEVWQNLLSQQGGTRSTNENITKDGNTIFCEWYNTPLVSESGEVLGVASLVQDITEKKLVEDEIKLLNETLEQRIAERTAELSQINKILVQEVSERKMAEESLKDSEKKSRAWLEHSPACTKIVDLDFNLQYMSTAGIKVLKIDDVSQFYGKPYPFDFYPDSSRNQMNKDMEKVKETGRIAEHEASAVDIEGNELWFRHTIVPVNDVEGQIDYLMIVSMDTTERKRSEEALQGSEERLLSLSRATFEGIVFSKKGVFLDCNEQFANLVGYELNELVGIDGLTLVHPEDRELSLSRITTGNEEPYEIRLLCKDGSIKFVEVHAQMMTINCERLRVTAFRDITERKKLEDELLKMQKLESVGVLAGGIAHDFNNNLQSILSNVTLAKSYAKPEDEVYEKLEEAKKVVLQSKSLTQQLLTFSRGGDPVRRTISISELIKDSANLTLSGSNVRCELGIPDDLWSVEADKGQLNQVISNLVINAVQAMPDGGNIKVWAENINVVEKGLLPVEEGNYVKITITDQGAGISQGHLQKIFDPYFTTKQKGSGLGLATCYSIIKKHNGHITVESEVGVGTVFHIYLPSSRLKTQKAPAPSEAEGVRPEHVGGKGVSGTLKGKVLLMDDEAIIKLAVTQHLRNLEYEVETAEEGAKAIELYNKAIETGKPFDAVIMDLTIPGGMGGKETIERLLEIDPEVRAIVASGYANDPIMAEFNKYGFSGVLAKPYEIDELDEALQKVMKSM